MAPLAQAWVRVNPDTKTFAHDTSTQTGKAFGGLHGHFSALGKTAGIALAGGAVAGVAGLAAVFKTGFSEVSQYQKGLAQANAVIKSTGGTANVTSKHVEDLAGTIQGYSGIQDDTVVSGENMLLTFTNIQNKAGKGNDVFDQSTKTLLDMSQALGEDTPNAAIQLGKALNDPIKGVTALQRVGVTFTDGQKKTIKSLVDSGHTMDAQKVILKELNKEFGGSAKAYGDTMPGQIDKAKRAFETVSQSIVTAVLPPLISLAQKVLPPIGRAFVAISHIVGDFVHGFTIGIDSLSDPQTKAAALGAQLHLIWSTKLKPALQAILPVIRSVASAIGGALAKVLPIIGHILTDQVIPAWVSIAKVVRDDVMPIVRQIVTFVVTKLAPALAKILGAAISAARAAFERIGKALHDHQKQIHEVIKVLTTLAGYILKVAVPILKVTFKVAFDIIGRSISAAITIISAFVTAINGIVGAVKWVVGHVKGLVKTLVGFFTALPGEIGHGILSLVNTIVNPFIDAFNLIIRAYDDTLGHLHLFGVGFPHIGEIAHVHFGEAAAAAYTVPGTGRARMALGGVIHAVPGGQHIIAGEAGRDERITPLDADGMTANDRRLLDAVLEQNKLLRAYLPAIGGDVADALNVAANRARLTARTTVRR